jgi:hypothetical protein
MRYVSIWLLCSKDGTVAMIKLRQNLAVLPDSVFSRQIWKILADLKVTWRAKNISGGLPISGRFLADLTNFAWVCF